jgi:hypothetical protein
MLKEQEENELALYKNVGKMTVMWSASIFCYSLLNFLNKYLEGSIFQNHYAESSAGILACLFGAITYSKFGMKISYFFSYGIAFFGVFIIFLLESGLLPIS